MFRSPVLGHMVTVPSVDRTSHPSGSRPWQRDVQVFPLRAPGHRVAPENRLCQIISHRTGHRSCGSPVGPTPCWLMTWAVLAHPRSAGGFAWIGQRLIRSGGS